ncbi:hypothetical protein SAMN05444320_12112 [Streptoalloteichus hindustanus]|uniref:Uncharacterized protein n=1 Tax=Streptoalloteichus hindustanus TaxID=2017 RepID=A0A1M5Q103_STRHI|nr:hypothetical protein SAMN05444320_12112 [Streptoalloteichus hindustanus]
MSALAGFKTMAEVTADDRARIAFGRVGGHSNDRLLVSDGPSGEVLLTPLASIPHRELLVWEDEQPGESLPRGLAHAAEGGVRQRDDLVGYEDG